METEKIRSARATQNIDGIENAYNVFLYIKEYENKEIVAKDIEPEL